jgi:hypothetical protein
MSCVGSNGFFESGTGSCFTEPLQGCAIQPSFLQKYTHNPWSTKLRKSVTS